MRRSDLRRLLSANCPACSRLPNPRVCVCVCECLSGCDTHKRGWRTPWTTLKPVYTHTGNMHIGEHGPMHTDNLHTLYTVSVETRKTAWNGFCAPGSCVGKQENAAVFQNKCLQVGAKVTSKNDIFSAQ